MGLTLQCEVVLLTLLTTALQLRACATICSLSIKMGTDMCTEARGIGALPCVAGQGGSAQWHIARLLAQETLHMTTLMAPVLHNNP